MAWPGRAGNAEATGWPASRRVWHEMGRWHKAASRETVRQIRNQLICVILATVVGLRLQFDKKAVYSDANSPSSDRANAARRAARDWADS
jgi:hypothetical protein